MADPLRRSVRVRCPAAHAFTVFTEKVDHWWPAGHRRLEGSRLTLEAKVGGRFFERSGSGDEAVLGEVLACHPPHSVSFTWHPGALNKPTRVDIRFVEEGEETVVHVLHSEADSALGDAWPQRVALFTRGWDTVLPAFVSLAERGLTAERDD